MRAFLAGAALAAALWTPAAQAASPASLIERVIGMAGVGPVALSPDGKWLATRSSRADIHDNRLRGTWMLIPTTGAAPILLPNGDDPASGVGDNDVEHAVWAPDSSRFYFRSMVDQELAIWEATVGGRVRKLTQDAANIDSFDLDFAKGRLVYRVGATREQILAAEAREYLDGVVLQDNVVTWGSLIRNYPWRGRMATMRTERDGIFPVTGRGTPRVMALDLGRPGAVAEPVKEEWQPALDRSRKEIARLVGFDREPGGQRAVYFGRTDKRDLFNNPAGDIGLSVGPMDAKQGELRACNDPACGNIRPPAYWRPGSDEVIFVTRQYGGISRLHAWDTKTDKVRLVLEVQGVVGAAKGSSNRFLATGCPVDARVAYCTLATANEPQRLATIDLDSGRVTTLFDPDPALRTYRFPPVAHLSWKDRHGYTVIGVFIRPAKWTGEKPPLLITSYRCEGFLEGGNSGYYHEYAMVERGIATLCINADGEAQSRPYPDKEIPAGQPARLQWLLDSWETGAELLVKRGDVDPRRIGVAGHSFSGEGVNYAISHSKMFSVAGSGHATITDPFAYQFGIFERGEIGRDLKRGYGVTDPFDDKEGFYAKASPAMNAHRIDAPVLIQTGDSEFRPGMYYFMQLRLLRKAVEFVVFPDGPHKIWQPMHRKVLVERFVDWFDFWMNAHEDPAPQKAAQYQRWRALKALRE